MAEKLVKAGDSWRMAVAAPPREVFAVMEQMIGTPPYRFEVTGPTSARIVEYERNSLVGHWRQLARRDAEGVQRTDDDGTPQWRSAPRWVSVEAVEVEAGTELVVTASRGVAGPLGRLPAQGAPTRRALQLIQLLTRGSRDRRTVYRERRIPDGPVTLVASWAGVLYPLYTEPRRDAPRGAGIHTASRLVADGREGRFVHVRAQDGDEGWVESDQIVPAPTEASRAAQSRTALLG